jgi:short-subunit dehydrogenase
VSSHALWITGASSGIGAALRRSQPFADAQVFGVARRDCGGPADLRLDLARRRSWERLAAHFAEVLRPGVANGCLLHFAGVGQPHGRAVDAELAAYTDSVLVNGPVGLIVAKAFLTAAADAGTEATVVLCSSPAAGEPLPGLSAYGAGKLAIRYWVGAVAAEGFGRILGIVPWAVDTPMLRDAVNNASELMPVHLALREAAARGELAPADRTAQEIWDVVEGDRPSGSIVNVGAVPAAVRLADEQDREKQRG